MATPVERPTPAAGDPGSSKLVNLTASSLPLYPWPLALARDTEPRRSATAPTAEVDEDPATADQIDQDFIAFRQAMRTDFTPFANDLGYLGKQLYIGFNFGESLVASLVFNGTDMLRGEGVLKNLGEIAWDVVLSAVYIAVDELYLHVPGLPPIVVLPDRAPADAPIGWRRPLPPQPGRDLVVPVPYVPSEAPQPLTVDEDDQGEADDIAEGAEGDDAETPPAEKQGDAEEDVDVDALGDIEEEPAEEEPAATDDAATDDADSDEPEPGEPAATTTPDSESGAEGSADTSGE
ncbi:hypothetical protein [Mycolicibacterium austroafricanum]|uniref:hypothetical protein n=1 Tax=Mycolicibacterium austroafricanum TaxID=39687 RepID=UPI001CA33793|nr:hypothetical protein [Mycolicibacterium austroafricanum]QZT60965.1 hypothetical protein JN085_18385 [Mycolicibacterium austroafricanum]